jgi:hypothetical protein
MSKTITITKCGECPECGFNMNAETREWDTQFCLITGDSVNVDSMPDNCPLPTDISRDLESEVARLKSEIRRYRYCMSNSDYRTKFR